MLSILWISCKTVNGLQVKDTNKIEASLTHTKDWFNAWELVSKDIFKLNESNPTRFVFFDSVYVYTTSPLTGKDGKIIEGPQLFKKKQLWYKKAHHGNLLLPDSSQTFIKMMIFASTTKEKEVKAFFIMPLLSFWSQEKIGDHGIGLEKLTTGVFTHEFSHTQQLGSFDKFGEYFEAYQSKYGTENFGDDMMQDIYEKDEKITSLYNKEFNLFTKAATVDKKERIALTKEALGNYYMKHKFILERDKKDLKILDDIWLTLEGLGQYAMYEYLINPKGGNLTEDEALKSIKTKWWSQEEGFALFYLLGKYKKSNIWANDFFNSDMKTIIEVLENEVK